MKKLMIVGAGSCQLNAIKKMKALGHHVIAADYNTWTQGKSLADESVLADTFDVEAIYESAKEHQIEGLLTVGTDQPVYTVSVVAERLNLPHFIDSETALWVTNKKEMKQRMTRFKMPTVPYALVPESFSSAVLMHIKPPYVIKPIDSQGQRGIYKVDTIDEIRMKFNDVLKYSRCDEILVEHYYESSEVTVSGWVTNGVAAILTITDRVTFPSDRQIGVCLAHRYPSVHQDSFGEKIADLTQRLCVHFGIEKGPIYFQFLIGDQGILVNEIACRIGGAYEDITIPYVTGIDILDLNIRGAYDNVLKKPHFEASKTHFFSTQLFFCKAGTIKNMTPLQKIKEYPFILDAGYNYRIGDEILSIENASQRAGYFIVTGQTAADVEANIQTIYERLEFIDEKGKNLVISYAEALNG